MKYKTLLLLPFILFPSTSLSHGDADWIRKNGKTAYCCTPTDCRQLSEEEVTQTREGFIWEGRLFKLGEPDLHPAEKEGWWGCKWQDKPRCLFIPLTF